MGGLDARTSAAGRGREARQAEQRKGGPMPSAATKPLTGVLPIAPTPIRDNGDLDLDGQRRVLDCMMHQGVDANCNLANYPSSSCCPTRSATPCSSCASAT